LFVDEKEENPQNKHLFQTLEELNKEEKQDLMHKI